MKKSILRTLKRPGDPRYPDGVKTVRLDCGNGEIVVVKTTDHPRKHVRFLFELTEEEKAVRMADLKRRLNE